MSELYNPHYQDLCIGRVIAVSPSRIIARIEVERDPLGSSAQLAIGNLVKLYTATTTIYGMISGLRVPLPSRTPADDLKIGEIDLIGEMVSDEDGESVRFRRGVSEFPVLGDAIYRTSPEDLAQVYAPPHPDAIRIGTVHPGNAVPAYVLADDLLGKHFSIVGTTGSGKSCAVVSILGSIIAQNPNAHVIVLDPHSEYSRAFGDTASVLSPNSGLYLPYWLFDFEEIAEVVIGSRSEEAEQRRILSEAIRRAKEPFFSRCALDGIGTVDTPVPYRMSDVLRHIDAALGELNRSESIAAYRALKNRIVSLQNDPRYAFAFASKMVIRDEMVDILRQLYRIPVEGKPITILDISEVPSEVLNVVVSMISRLIFQFAVWSDTPFPILIICEEAHRYMPRDERLGFEPAKRALSRIAKEGRKYGVSLCVVSQRPSDLAPSLLSECNTMFALRMTSQGDQDIIRSALPEGSTRLMDFLPSLRNREAIVVGEGVTIPMRICFSPLAEERWPRSATASFTKAWTTDQDGSEVARIVDSWRRGRRQDPAAPENEFRKAEASTAR